MRAGFKYGVDFWEPLSLLPELNLVFCSPLFLLAQEQIPDHWALVGVCLRTVVFFLFPTHASAVILPCDGFLLIGVKQNFICFK